MWRYLHCTDNLSGIESSCDSLVIIQVTGIPSAVHVGVSKYWLTTVYVPSVLLIMLLLTLPGMEVCHVIRDGGLPLDDLHVATACSWSPATTSVLASAEFCGMAESGNTIVNLLNWKAPWNIWIKRKGHYRPSEPVWLVLNRYNI